ncbi:MAG: radical SAM protein [Candidatus Komeilibacteria bacterium]|nr:radical SAM protein [Candidatus Komeilibacteria bacterium]
MPEIDLGRRLELVNSQLPKRILMINPQSEVQPEQASRYPLGLFSLATFIAEKFQHPLDVSILDLQIQPSDFNIAQTIEETNPDIVMTTAITPYEPYAQKIGRIVRQVKPNALSFIGGYHATVKPGEVIQPGNFDIGAIGEGEETVLEFLNALAAHAFDHPEKLLDIPGLFFRGENGQTAYSRLRIPKLPLSQYPWASKGLEFLVGQTVSYQVFGDTKKFTSKPGTLITSRGCVHNCANCGSKQMFQVVRNRPPKDVVGEVRYLFDNQQTKNFYFADDTLNQDPERLKEISRLLIQEGLPIEWVGMARVDTLDAQLYNLAVKSGAVEFAFGVESADPRVLAALEQDKNNLANVVTAREMVKDAGAEAKFYLMVGNPQETQSSSQMTAEFLQATKPEKIRVSRSMPYPGAPFINDIEVVPPYDKNYEYWWAFPPPSDPFGPLLNLTRTPLMSPEQIEESRQLLIQTHLGYGGKV